MCMGIGMGMGSTNTNTQHTTLVVGGNWRLFDSSVVLVVDKGGAHCN